MLLSIILILSALYWLLLETNWLRISLLVGNEFQPVEHPRMAWRELCSSMYDGDERTGTQGMTGHARDENYIRLPDVYEPLCGWDWLENTMHVIPSCDLELKYDRVRYRIHLEPTPEASGILTKVMKAQRVKVPRATRRKVKGVTVNPHYQPVSA